jgi:hypothetical protein
VEVEANRRRASKEELASMASLAREFDREEEPTLAALGRMQWDLEHAVED